MKTKNWEFFCARTADNRLLRFTNQDQAVINLLLRGLQILGYADGKNVASSTETRREITSGFQRKSMNWLGSIQT